MGIAHFWNVVTEMLGMEHIRNTILLNYTCQHGLTTIESRTMPPDPDRLFHIYNSPRNCDIVLEIVT